MCCKKFYMYLRDAIKCKIPSLFLWHHCILYTSKNLIVIFCKNVWRLMKAPMFYSALSVFFFWKNFLHTYMYIYKYVLQNFFNTTLACRNVYFTQNQYLSGSNVNSLHSIKKILLEQKTDSTLQRTVSISFTSSR